MKKCPHCEATIEYLNYEVEVREWGSYGIENDDYQPDDSEWIDGTSSLRCPECGYETSVEELIDTEDENSPLNEETGIVDNQSEMIENTITRNFSAPYFICPKCKAKLECEDADEVIECYSCGTEVGQFNSKAFNF